MYKPKSSTFNYNMDKYTPEMLDHIKKVMRPMLIYFGYARIPGQDCGPYSYIDIGPLSDEELLDYKAYEKDNEKHFKLSFELGDKVGEKYKFTNIKDWNKFAGVWGGTAYNPYYGLAPTLLEK